MPVEAFEQADVYKHLALQESRSKQKYTLLGEFEVTGYTLAECGKPPSHPEYGITASGTEATKYNTLAATLPFGTKLYIPHFKDWPNRGIFTVEDRGEAITEGKLDVYFGDPVKERGVRKKAFKFGRRDLKVYIVKEAEDA